ISDLSAGVEEHQGVAAFISQQHIGLRLHKKRVTERNRYIPLRHAKALLIFDSVLSVLHVSVSKGLVMYIIVALCLSFFFIYIVFTATVVQHIYYENNKKKKDDEKNPLAPLLPALLPVNLLKLFFFICKDFKIINILRHMPLSSSDHRKCISPAKGVIGLV